MIGTAQNKWIHGAVAGLSVHLQPQRQHPPAASDLDNMFVDVGATTVAEARAGGADVLSPVVIDRKFCEMGFGKWTAPAIGDRFGVAALLEVSDRFDPDRLHQEAILIASKADIREELDRLAAHIAQARSLIVQGGAIGRRLDFLAQELHRETNTLCAKSNDVELTTIALELKSVVEQFREQVQNLE